MSKTTTRERAIRLTDAQVRAALDGRLSEVREPVTERDCRRGLTPRHLVDLSRATDDRGFPVDDDGDVLPVESWSGGSSPAPDERYRNHYLHVPFAHPDDGWESRPEDDARHRVFCPWQPGDVLWCQETFQVCDVTYDDYNGGWEGGYPLDTIPREKPDFHHWVTYAADGDDGPWRPSTQMRWASRIEFEVTAVRVEKLSEIDEAGAIAEGTDRPSDGIIVPYSVPPRRVDITYVDWFIDAWNRRNPKHPFDSDCWVWVRQLRRIKP